MRRIRSIIVLAALAAVTVLPMTPAAAATSTTVTHADLMTSWFGTVHVTRNTSTSYGGWVDGNGPDSYTAWARCRSGRNAFGVTRWAGDRRQSFATCSDGIASGASSRGFILDDR
jgi:hypothetical protein